MPRTRNICDLIDIYLDNLGLSERQPTIPLDSDKLDFLRDSFALVTEPKLASLWNRPSPETERELVKFINIIETNPDLDELQVQILLEETVSKIIFLSWTEEEISALKERCLHLFDSGAFDDNPETKNRFSGLLYGLDLYPGLPCQEIPFLRALGLKLMLAWVQNHMLTER
tara:strand:- start:44 stop:556 length:513 start_codon:yes stop_codon:yes gene_type:complete